MKILIYIHNQMNKYLDELVLDIGKVFFIIWQLFEFLLRTKYIKFCILECLLVTKEKKLFSFP
jgi:hypothetical protein